MTQQQASNQQPWAKLKPLTASLPEILLIENPHYLAGDFSQEASDISCKIHRDKLNNYWIEKIQKTVNDPLIQKESQKTTMIKPLQTGTILCLTHLSSKTMMEDYIFEPLMEVVAISNDEIHIQQIRSFDNVIIPQQDNNSQNENLCSICKYYTLSEVILAPCLHTFCDSCVTKLKQGTQKCPECIEEGDVAQSTGDSTCNNSVSGSAQGRVYVEEMQGYYEGEWLEDKPHGVGKIVYKDGGIYDGEVRNGKAEGQGKLTYFFKYTYEGEFKNGMKEGKGLIKYYNGDSYEGSFVADKREGQGKLLQSQKRTEVYEGDMKDDKKDGFGKNVYGDGTVYVGEFKEGLIHGRGKIVYFYGDYYDGEFQNHKKEGQGTLFKVNGSTVKGQWKQGKHQGGIFRSLANKFKFVKCASPPKK